MPNFSDILFSLRKECKFSQQELANHLGLTRSAIGMYEIGQREPDFETLELIADFFNVDMDYLTGRSEVRLKTPVWDKLKFFGTKLFTLRLREGLTQEELSFCVNIPLPDICLYEKGLKEPDLTTLQTFANFFDVEIGDFFFVKEEKLAAFGNELFEKFSKLSAKDQALVRSTMLSMIEQLLNAQSEQ